MLGESDARIGDEPSHSQESDRPRLDSIRISFGNENKRLI